MQQEIKRNDVTLWNVTMISDRHRQENAWTAERLQRASYKDLGSPSEVEDRFLQHLLCADYSCRSALDVLLMSSSSTTRDFSLEVDAFELLLSDCVLGTLLLKFPSTLLPILENAIVRAQKVLQAQKHDEGDTTFTSVKGDKGDGKGLPATRVHARLVHLPPTITRNSVASMKAQDVGKIVQLSGTVVRTSPVQMYESARTYKCMGKDGCKRTFMQYADLEQRTNALAKPDRCPLTIEGGQRCKGTKLQVEKDGSVHTDYQEIKIQEAASKIGIGHIPRSLMIKLQHDLVDSCQPGDEIQLVGSLLAQWQQHAQPGIECNVGMALDAHSVRVVQENGSSAWNQSDDNSSNAEMEKFKKEFDAYWADPRRKECPIEGRDFICKAVCPKLYGLHIIKLGLLITLIGGVQASSDNNKNNPTQSHFQDENESQHVNNAPEPFRMALPENSKTDAVYCDRTSLRSSKRYESTVQIRRRDMSHMLIIGDPGTGKVSKGLFSSFVRAYSNISLFLSQSQILRFAAALCPRSVLTTGVGTTSAGLTCAAVREGSDKDFALEAGALVLADKGICCIDEFGCIRNEDRTTIHEAMEQQTLSVAKAGIVCKLNCRATVIAVMNPKDCIYDNHASLSSNTGLGTPLLSRFDLIFKLVDSSDAERDSNVTTYLLNRAIQGTGLDCTNNNGSILDDAPWQIEKLRAYISIVKDRFQPAISDGAALLLERHYEKVRSAQSFIIPVTVRFLESLIRLTQAHARLMYRNIATLEDAVAVLRVMECTAYAYGGFDGNVQDVENVMYVDPMYMDVCSLEPDEEFVVFQYQILKRYDMLNHMTDDSRRKAQLLLDGDENMDFGNGNTATAGNWLNVENPRDRQESTVSLDHYGRSYFTPPGTQNAPSRKRGRS